MNSKFVPLRTRRPVHAAAVLAACLAVSASPMKDAAAANLHANDIPRALEVAVSYFYQTKVRRRAMDAACYFDPQVKRSMACTWSSYDTGADSFFVQQEVRRRALKRCKKNGGKSCVLFYRNGKLRYDGLSPHLAEKFETILRRIPSYLTEATPLPEGAGIRGGFRNWFERERQYREEQRKKRRGKNMRYAICANERGVAMTYAVEGPKMSMRHVRRECAMRCQVYADWLSKGDPCFVIYEDGRFASPAAQRAVNEQ